MSASMASTIDAQFLLRPSTESGHLASAVGSSAPGSADKPRTLPSTKGSEGEARGNLAHGSALSIGEMYCVRCGWVHAYGMACPQPDRREPNG